MGCSAIRCANPDITVRGGRNHNKTHRGKDAEGSEHIPLRASSTGCSRKLSVPETTTFITSVDGNVTPLMSFWHNSCDCSNDDSGSAPMLALTVCNPTLNNDGLQQLQQKPRDQDLFAQLQQLLTDTHKPYDNWTRDRGCNLHRRHSHECSDQCIFKNRAQVPNGYVLRKAFRNSNAELWEQYCQAKQVISLECATNTSVAFSCVPALSSFGHDTELSAVCNEWRLLHGTSHASACSICSSNFRPNLVGTGATRREPGKEKGVPLYGSGVYAAERITKADEYSKPIFDSGLGTELYTVLVLRCIGGRVKVSHSNGMDEEQLHKDVHNGSYHSVVGDRLQKLGKPYREFVIYDQRQCFPEFLLLYERTF